MGELLPGAVSASLEAAVVLELGMGLAPLDEILQQGHPAGAVPASPPGDVQPPTPQDVGELVAGEQRPRDLRVSDPGDDTDRREPGAYTTWWNW